MDKVGGATQGTGPAAGPAGSVERREWKGMGLFRDLAADPSLSGHFRGMAGRNDLGDFEAAGVPGFRGGWKEGEAAQRFARMECLPQTLGDGVHGELWKALGVWRTLVCRS